MKHYHVTTVIQSRDTSNPPVSVNWYQGNSEGQAIASLVSAAVTREESTTLPLSVQYTVLSVHLDITEVFCEDCDGVDDHTPECVHA